MTDCDDRARSCHGQGRRVAARALPVGSSHVAASGALPAVLRSDTSHPGAQNELQRISPPSQAYRIVTRNEADSPCRCDPGPDLRSRSRAPFSERGAKVTLKDVKGPAAESLALQLRVKRSELMVQELEAVALRLFDLPRVQRRDRGRDRRRSAHLGPDVLSLLPQQGRRAAGAHRPAQQEPPSSARRPTGQRGATGITSPGARRTARDGRPRTRAALDRHHHRQPVGAELRPRWASN